MMPFETIGAICGAEDLARSAAALRKMSDEGLVSMSCMADAYREQRATLIALRNDIDAARAETSNANENLASAMGYIDRILDLERPSPAPTFYPPTASAPGGPCLKSAPSGDSWSAMGGRLR